MFQVIYQTREETVFHQTPRRELQIRRSARGVFLKKFEVFGYPDETLSRVFDISSQSKQNLKSKRRSKIVKIYAN